jgi:hypothetical protein
VKNRNTEKLIISHAKCQQGTYTKTENLKWFKINISIETVPPDGNGFEEFHF